MSLESASGSTLDAELSKILNRFAHGRQNSGSLREASTRRRNHREVLLDWLSSHFKDGQLFPAGSSFVWINDIIATNCTDEDDLEYVADLLIERRYDSPWIIHDNGDTLQRKVDSREASKISLKWHSPHCGHIYDSEASNDIRKQNHLDHTWDNISSKFDCLGLAGFLPLKSWDADPGLRHESQLRQWEAHVRIDGNTADVSYVSKEVLEGKSFATPPTPAPEQPQRVVPHEAISVGQSLKPHARSLSQELRTPMQSVVGMLDAMYATVQEAAESQVDPQVRKAFGTLEDIEVVQGTELYPLSLLIFNV